MKKEKEILMCYGCNGDHRGIKFRQYEHIDDGFYCVACHNQNKKNDKIHNCEECGSNKAKPRFISVGNGNSMGGVFL